MTREDIAKIIRSTMPEQLYSKAGAVLLTGTSTLKRSSAYVMGLNPGGDPETINNPIIETIAPMDGTSCYTHECWQPGCKSEDGCSHVGEDGTILETALVTHQRNMIELAKLLGATPATIFSVNAVFGRSTSRAKLKEQTGHNLQEWWEACWPVHQKFLAIVRPKFIVSLGYGEGSSAFGLLRAKANHPGWRKFGDEGRRGGWAFDARLELAKNDILSTTVVGVPHPSYYAPGPILAEMLVELRDGVLAA